MITNEGGFFKYETRGLYFQHCASAEHAGPESAALRMVLYFGEGVKMMNRYFYPTLVEVEEAEAVFKAGLLRYRDGDNSEYRAIKCALADVWAAARCYEYEREREVQRLEG